MSQNTCSNESGGTGLSKAEIMMLLCPPKNLKGLIDLSNDIQRIYYGHILHMEDETAREEAIQVLWDIYIHVTNVLEELGEIQTPRVIDER